MDKQTTKSAYSVSYLLKEILANTERIIGGSDLIERGY